MSVAAGGQESLIVQVDPEDTDEFSQGRTRIRL
jgi:hypothetical protein